MTVETSVAQPEAAYDEWSSGRWSLTGRIVVLLWLLAVVVLVGTGERRSDLGALHGGLADGSITEVLITGLPEGDPGRGYSTVKLTWESRLINRYTEIVVASSERMGERAGSGDDLPVVIGDPVPTLQQLRSDVTILRDDHRGGASWEAAGWTLHGTPATAVLVLWIATLFLLMGGPQPWRATRWAWFWIVLASPLVGAVAYAVLGGPLAAGRPADRARRLTGGWAFLIAVVLLGGFEA